MTETKITLTDDQAKFLGEHASLGFPDKSSLVREAIERLRKELAEQRLRESAELYAEVSAEDAALRELTELALEGWPE
jgi:Arc/MetJ-type ribon-helix-helix transcriptional regulator